MTEKNRPAAGVPPFEEGAAEPPKKPRVRKPFPSANDLFAMFGIVLGMQIAVSLAVSFVLLVLGVETDAAEPLQQGRRMAAIYLLAMTAAYFMVLWYRHMRGGSGSLGRFSVRGLNPMLLLWAFVLMLAAGIVCEPLLSLLPAVKEYEFGRGGWALVTLVVAAPVLEELLCRGVVLESLRARYGAATAWAVSSFFFGALHLQPVLVVNAFVIGLILGYIYIVADSLWATIILHALNNAVAYLLLLTGYGDATLAGLVGDRTIYWIVYAGAAAVTMLSAWMVWRTLRRLGSGRKNEDAA